MGLNPYPWTHPGDGYPPSFKGRHRLPIQGVVPAAYGAVLQIRINPSLEAVASMLPSGEKLTEVAESVKLSSSCQDSLVIRIPDDYLLLAVSRQQLSVWREIQAHGYDLTPQVTGHFFTAAGIPELDNGLRSAPGDFCAGGSQPVFFIQCCQPADKFLVA